MGRTECEPKPLSALRNRPRMTAPPSIDCDRDQEDEGREGVGPLDCLSPSLAPPDRPCAVDLNDRQEEVGTRIEATEAIIKNSRPYLQTSTVFFPWLFRLTDDGPDGGDDSSFCEND